MFPAEKGIFLPQSPVKSPGKFSVIFCNRKQTILKILCGDKTGFVSVKNGWKRIVLNVRILRKK